MCRFDSEHKYGTNLIRKRLFLFWSPIVTNGIYN